MNEAEEPKEWLWWGVDQDGRDHISFGRWQRHPCQHRYKFAIPQATEHDHDFSVRDHLRALRRAKSAISGLSEAGR